MLCHTQSGQTCIATETQRSWEWREPRSCFSIFGGFLFQCCPGRYHPSPRLFILQTWFFYLIQVYAVMDRLHEILAITVSPCSKKQEHESESSSPSLLSVEVLICTGVCIYIKRRTFIWIRFIHIRFLFALSTFSLWRMAPGLATVNQRCSKSNFSTGGS